MYIENFERYELKFRLSETQYDSVFRALSDIAHVDEYGRSKIMNIYYDTPDYRMIRTSIEKPVYKEKLRIRTYGVPDENSAAFVEIKKKYKGIVYKRRIAMPYYRAVDYLAGKAEPPVKNQISNEIDYLAKVWNNPVPTAVVSYDRIAMVVDNDPELRITFDDNIRYRMNNLDLTAGDSGKEILEDGERIMEIKVAKAIPLSIVRILSKNEVYPISFSKYGNAYLNYLCTKENVKYG